MKVVAFNGSPHKEGNTYQAMRMVLDELEKEGIETEIIHVGGQAVRGCIACYMCAKNKDEKCVLTGDDVNLWIQKLKEADGVLLGSPVHFASISATMKAFLDRAFYTASGNDSLFRHKVGAAVVAVRRSGGVTAFEQLNRYINYTEMLMPAGNYWSVIHGAAPGEVQKDAEGVQIMKLLGKNMAWLLKMREAGMEPGMEPELERKVRMNFVRKDV